MTLESARSFLFVPATRPDRFGKALATPADCVIVDLEDAVAPAEKPGARDQLEDALRTFGPAQLARTLVRVNACDAQWHEGDLCAIAPWCNKGLGGVMVPKTESVEMLAHAASILGPSARLLPLVESLRGLDSVVLISRAAQVVRLAFGNLDFQLDVGMQCTLDEPELAPARFQVVTASRRAGLAAPVDGVTVDVTDAARPGQEAKRARAFGFGGKLCIHPSQVDGVNAAFSPLPAEVEWAERVLAGVRKHGGGAFSLDGRMVDLPVIRLAERTIRRARATPVR